MTGNIKFEAVITLADDFAVTEQAVREGCKEQKDILSAICDRINRDQERVKSRMEELRAALADSGRSITIRGLAQKEMQELSAVVYSPTPDELEAFWTVTENAEQAIKDLRATGAALKEALGAATKELEKIRKETVGTADMELMQKWVESEKQKFEKVGGNKSKGGVR